MEERVTHGVMLNVPLSSMIADEVLNNEGSQYHCAKSEPQLQRILRSVYTRSMPDPMCRFMYAVPQFYVRGRLD